MATGLPSLPSEIIEKIVVFLPLQDVANSMLVCKQWNELLKSEQFWKSYTLKHYDFSDEEAPTGHLEVWQDPEEWYCYWDDREDKSDIHVFSDPPKRWKCGIVHLANFTLESHKDIKYKDFLRAIVILMKLQKAGEELQLDCGAYGNESDGLIEVCLFPWNKRSLPHARDIVSLFHFNPEMCKDPIEDNKAPEDEEEDDDQSEEAHWNTLRSFCDDQEKALAFFSWLKKIFTPFVRIVIGSESMNPVPCFILANLAPGWVGGVLTSLVHT